MAVGLCEPLGDFTEFLRAVREGCERIGAEDAKLLRAAGEDIGENRPFDWDTFNTFSLRKSFVAKTYPSARLTTSKAPRLDSLQDLAKSASTKAALSGRRPRHIICKTLGGAS